MLISTGGERSECKPGVQAARTYRNCKVHCRQLKTAQYSADSDNQGTLSSKTVYQQCCKARPPDFIGRLFIDVLVCSSFNKIWKDVSLQETDHFSFNQLSFSNFVCHGHFGCAADVFYVRNERSRIQTEKRNIAKANRNFHVHVLL